MFNSIVAIRNASREANSTCPHWFDASSMRFFNSKVYDNVFPLGQRGAIFISSEYREDPAKTAYSLRYASRNSDGAFTMETIDGFMDYESFEEAESAADAYQRFYRQVLNIS